MYQLYKFSIAFSIITLCFQPNAFILLTSVSFLMDPCDFWELNTKLPSKPILFLIKFAKSKIEISLPVPILICVFITSYSLE